MIAFCQAYEGALALPAQAKMLYKKTPHCTIIGLRPIGALFANGRAGCFLPKEENPFMRKVRIVITYLDHSHNPPTTHKKGAPFSARVPFFAAMVGAIAHVYSW